MIDFASLQSDWPFKFFSKCAKNAINLGLQMVRVFCCVIIKVIGATTRTRVGSPVILINQVLTEFSSLQFSQKHLSEILTAISHYKMNYLRPCSHVSG